MSNYPFKNLVFQGCGIKGIAYLGMLEVLDAEGILDQIERVAGASAGAITSVVTSFGLSAGEMKDIVDSLDYSKIPQVWSTDPDEFESLPSVVREALDDIFGDFRCVYRLIKRYGWYSSEYFYGWLRDTIASQFTVHKDKYTFADFQNVVHHKDKRHFADLYLIGADISTHHSRVFSVETTPNVEVALATRISMSIPLFFEAIEFEYPGQSETHTFADGGTTRVYPINIFDKRPKYGNNFRGDVNLETLGGYMLTPENCPNRKPVTDFISYVENLFESLLDVQEDFLINNPDDLMRTVRIDDYCISATDFSIKVGDEKYTKLYNAGQTATRDYLDNYVSE